MPTRSTSGRCSQAPESACSLRRWVDSAMLRFALNQRVGWTGLSRSYLAQLWSLALGAAAIAFVLKLQMAGFGPRIQGLTVLSVYGGFYFAGAWMIGIPEFAQFTDQIRRRFFPRSSQDSSPKSSPNSPKS